MASPQKSDKPADTSNTSSQLPSKSQSRTNGGNLPR